MAAHVEGWWIFILIMSFQNTCGRLGRQTSARTKTFARLKITFVDMTYPKGWTESLPLCPLIFSCLDLEGHFMLYFWTKASFSRAIFENTHESSVWVQRTLQIFNVARTTQCQFRKITVTRTNGSKVPELPTNVAHYFWLNQTKGQKQTNRNLSTNREAGDEYGWEKEESKWSGENLPWSISVLFSAVFFNAIYIWYYHAFRQGFRKLISQASNNFNYKSDYYIDPFASDIHCL